MRLYVLYALVLAGIVIASLSVVKGISENMRRWLIVAVSVLVIIPGALYLIFGPAV
jgi:cation transport ATPase